MLVILCVLGPGDLVLTSDDVGASGSGNWLALGDATILVIGRGSMLLPSW